MNRSTKLWMTVSLLTVTLPLSVEAAPVNIPDAHLKAAIEVELGVTDPEPADMLNLTSLSASNESISDLTGLETAVNLTSLTLDRNQISDVSPLAGLTNLTGLSLVNNQISDISPMTGLTNLARLYLGINSISDISPLAGLTNLTLLTLSRNSISDISPLTGLTNLTFLALSSNSISDISALAGMMNLEDLYLNDNDISDISSLMGLTNLTYLNLTANLLTFDDYNDLLHIQANNPGINLQSDLDSTPNLTVTKMTVKAGKTREALADSFTVMGTFDATADDFTAADTVYVNVGLYEETIDGADFKQAGKKPKFTYKDKGSITSLSLDMKKGRFKIIAKNVDLTGTSAPVEVVLVFGEYVGLGQAVEDVINAKKYLPMQLQSGFADALRVEKAICKPGKENNVKNLVISGSLATADEIDLRTASLLLRWGTAEHAVGLGEFVLKGKTKYQYKKRPDDLDPATIVISIDPTKCTFQIVARNTLWTWQNSPVNFGLEFGSFNETEEVAFE